MRVCRFERSRFDVGGHYAWRAFSRPVVSPRRRRRARRGARRLGEVPARSLDRDSSSDIRPGRPWRLCFAGESRALGTVVPAGGHGVASSIPADPKAADQKTLTPAAPAEVVKAPLTPQRLPLPPVGAFADRF